MFGLDLILGALVVALWVKAIPAAVADAVTMMRASKAGEWGLISDNWKRRDARKEARRKAWQDVRANRSRKAGGDGTYRPGVGAYMSDVYHGLWEDQLEKRAAVRAARPPVGPDGRRPGQTSFADRLDERITTKVQGLREKTGRVGHLLLDPVEFGPRPVADVVDRPRTTTGPTINPMGACESCGRDTTAAMLVDTAYGLVCGQCAREDALYDRGERKPHDTWETPDGLTCETCGEQLQVSAGGVVQHLHSPDDNHGAHGWFNGDYLRTVDCAHCQARVPEPLLVDAPNGAGRVCKACAAVLASADMHPAADADGPLWTCPGCGARLHRDGLTGAWEHPQGSTCPKATNTDNTTDTDTTTATGTVPAADEKGSTMTTATGDLITTNEAVVQHEQALEFLRRQLEDAAQFVAHITGATTEVEELDAARGQSATLLAALAESMEATRYDAASTQGSAESAGLLTAGAIAGTQEHLEAAAETGRAWVAQLNESIEQVQASLHNVQATYGEAAETVQSTGIAGAALEAN
ncbi:hypothetical protein [Melissospora conviva]|uniref:hypothetical protein n=1 Tax=Melissospora conviva TaxID=3388432 RepID=UPI003C1F2F30